DQYKDNQGLSEDATFKTLAGQVPSERVASLYVNLTEANKIMALAALAGADASRPGVAITNGAVLLALSAQNDGMQIDVATQVDMTDMADIGFKMNPNAKPGAAILADVPAGSLGLMAGSDLKTT